jgi:hypothetical protein
MKGLFQAIKNFIIGKSVDSILATFTNIVSDLEKVAAKHQDDIAIQTEIEKAAQASRAFAQTELDRANQAVAKVKALLPV